MLHRIQADPAEEKRGPAIPKRKAGPALQQNHSILSASCLLISPRFQASRMLFAPTGYPPKNPLISNDSAPFGIPNKRPTGRSRGRLVPIRLFTRIPDSRKKGNREGTTVRKHRSMPSAAANYAVLLSRINISIPKAATTPGKILHLPMSSPRKNLCKG